MKCDKPRGEGKYTSDFKNKRQYNYYKKHAEDPLSKELYNKIWVDFIEAGLPGAKEQNIKGIIHKIIFTNFEWVMPRRMGYLRLRKKKLKYPIKPDGTLDKNKAAVDWGETWKLWQSDEEARLKKTRVFYTNEHSRGCKVIWKWDKKICNFKNKTFYKFDINRTLDRTLAKILKDPKNRHLDYFY